MNETYIPQISKEVPQREKDKQNLEPIEDFTNKNPQMIEGDGLTP